MCGLRVVAVLTNLSANNRAPQARILIVNFNNQSYIFQDTLKS